MRQKTLILTAINSQVVDQTIQISRTRNFEYGLPALRPPLRRTRINWCKELRFLDPPKSTVALVSFPGSGNTWLRYLLQQATGEDISKIGIVCRF